MEEQELVFVYGTLKRGHGNNYLLPESSFMGPAVTQDKYSMYHNGIPYVSKKKKKTRIGGELYSVNKEVLKSLDLLEGHPQWYKREMVTVQRFANRWKDDIISLNAWLYFNEDIPKNAREIKGGIFMTHQNEYTFLL
tara:strand:- start:4317 stop:4727 length:411 start_codon:yes stop_codon:yes gene_type:complete